MMDKYDDADKVSSTKQAIDTCWPLLICQREEGDRPASGRRSEGGGKSILKERTFERGLQVLESKHLK